MARKRPNRTKTPSRLRAKKKKVLCPECGMALADQEKVGQHIAVECPKCRNKRVVTYLRRAKRNRLRKLLAIFSFLMLFIALLIIIQTPPASGYELSIYTAFPGYFWIALISGILGGLLLLLNNIFHQEKSKYWVLGLCAILLGNGIFLLLPLFRGYFFFGGANADIFSHIGWMKEIIETGHIFENNFYPIIHIFTVILSEILGVSINEILWFIPSFFTMIYVMFIFLLAKTIAMSRNQALLISAFSTPLIFSTFHLTTHPSFFSFTFLPLLLFLYHKRNLADRKIKLSLLIMLLCLFIVFFHPMTTIISVIIFLMFIGTTFLIRKRAPQSLPTPPTPIHPHKAFNIILMLTVCFLAWYTVHQGGLDAIRSIWQGLIYGSEFTIATHYLSVLGLANLSIFQVFRLFAVRYGAVILYSGSALLFLIIIGKRFFFNRRFKELELAYGMQLIAAFFAAMVMMFTYFIVINPIRSSRFFIMVATIFNGLIWYLFYMRRKTMKQGIKESRRIIHIGRKLTFNMRKSKGKLVASKTRVSALLLVLLSLSSILCLINVYPSPIMWQPNEQFTDQNFAGSTWMAENRDVFIQNAQDYGFNLLRIEHYINGINIGNRRMTRMGRDSLNIPTHFGYETNDTLAQVFNFTRTYISSTENGRQGVNAFPANVQDRCVQFTSDDFARLHADSTVVKIYENGELECWFVERLI